MNQLNPPSDTRSGFAALVGAPNAGKSTLMNQLVGAKVSIVTHKVQTTRSIIRGVAIRNQTQIVFVDTPGIFQPKRRLDKAMVNSAWKGAKDADCVLFLLDCERGLNDELTQIMGQLADYRAPKFLVLNKIDRVDHPKLLALAAQGNEICAFDQTFMISATTGDGCDDLMEQLEKLMPLGPWFYPEDQISDLPMRLLAAELTREKLYLRLHKELPYASHVETELWERDAKGKLRVEQTIYVERDSQKKIVIGKNGSTIKTISMASRQELSEILEEPVSLYLFVKVRKSWGDDPERYRQMGLEFPT